MALMPCIFTQGFLYGFLRDVHNTHNDDLCVFSRYTGLFAWALERRPQYPE